MIRTVQHPPPESIYFQVSQTSPFPSVVYNWYKQNGLLPVTNSIMSMPLDYSAVAVGSVYTNSSEGQLKCLLPAQLPSSSFANNRKELVLRPSKEAAITDTKIIKHLCDFWYGENSRRYAEQT